MLDSKLILFYSPKIRQDNITRGLVNITFIIHYLFLDFLKLDRQLPVIYSIFIYSVFKYTIGGTPLDL
jgi:hypothetical protein